MYGLMSHGLHELQRLQARPRRTKRLRLSRRFRQRIFWRDGGKCVYCERPVAFKDATMDHVQPLVRQGKFRSKENIVTACRNCNQKKDNLVLENLDDLAPDALWMKFDKTVRDTKTRKGHYCEWVTTHYDNPAAVI
jgi:5-methylcytosine-specific restriction endonuclease McrA